MSDLIVTAVVGAVTLVVGCVIGFWIANRRARSQVAKAEDVQKRFDDYRQEVAEHFGRTAKHFQAIGEEYRELYEHMASGAETLFELPAAERKLEAAPGIAMDGTNDDAARTSDPATSEACDEGSAKTQPDTDESRTGEAAQPDADTAERETAKGVESKPVDR